MIRSNKKQLATTVECGETERLASYVINRNTSLISIEQAGKIPCKEITKIAPEVIFWRFYQLCPKLVNSLKLFMVTRKTFDCAKPLIVYILSMKMKIFTKSVVVA